MKKLSITMLVFLSVLNNAQKTKSSEKDITEVVISKKKKKKYKNPAHEILEKLIAKKNRNNPENLKSYSSENHSRMEISMNSLGNLFQNSKAYKDLKNIMDSSKDSLGDGSTLLPVFISENISDYFYQKSPEKKAEIIKKSKLEGVGIEDNVLFSQLMSSTFIRYNFYNNYIRVLDKEFISPLNDSFAFHYDYELINRDYQENDRGYYKINFKPKRASDLAFDGTLLIDHSTYSLYKIEANVSKSANINFVNNVKIEQEMVEIPDTEVFMPKKAKIILETAKLGKNGMSGILTYNISSRNFVVNQEFSQDRFDKPLIIQPTASNKDDFYWERNRHEPLSESDKKKYAMIDEIKNLPSIKTYLDLIDIALKGYYDIGKIELGPVLQTIGYNNIEGTKIKLGFRTNNKFSDKWIFGGYAGYGFLDKELKYGGNIDYIISRDPWMQAGISASHDLEMVAFQYGNSFIKEGGLFEAFSKNGNAKIKRTFWKNTYQGYFQVDLYPSIRQKFILRHYTFNPLFDFSYTDDRGNVLEKFGTTEMIWETQWRPGRKTLQSNRNQQIAINNNYNPVVTLRVTRAFKDLFSGDFDYSKIHFNIRQSVPMGILGNGQYSITAGIIPDRVPYPLLENHLGNEFIFYNRDAFNMMRFFEFTSNKYASLQYTQNLEGLITNRLPLIKKLNWRNHITFNYLIGDLDHRFNTDGKLNSLKGKPYMEIGYGVSNILRFIRVDFTHRLTHLHNTSNVFQSDPPKFSIKISAQIRL